MALTWRGNQSDFDSCNLGALAVIYPLLKRMNVAQLIDQHLPADPRSEFSYGRVLSLLIAARLYQPTALLNVSKWAEQSGADILWEMPVKKINDDRLGRALDALFTQRHSILAYLALHVSQEFNVPLSELHYDPTHILFTGAYDDAEPREGVVGAETIRSDGTLKPAHITKGRGTDDAPDGALMIHAGLCTHVDEFGPLPLFGHTVDGNQNGRTAIAEQFALIRQHLRPPELTMFSDRGTYSVGHLWRLKQAGFDGVCSAPWKEFRSLFDQHRQTLVWKTASYLSVEQQRRRADNSELPLEHYEVAALRHTLVDTSSKQELPCRVIFVYSTADEQVVRQQRQKQIDKIHAALEQVQRSVAAGRHYSDQDSISRRVTKLFGAKHAARYFRWELVELNAAEQATLPKPGRGCRPAKQRFVFTFDQAAVDQDAAYDGYSALVTSVPQQQASADSVFTKFKEQNYSEHANRQFKGPLAVRPVYLHSPQRVEALVFLMMIALTAYFLIQRLYRQSVATITPQNQADAKLLKKERRTTSQTILRAFQSYTLLIHRTRLGREVQATRLTSQQRQLLQRLGFPTPAQVLSQLLPRPPS